MNLARVVADIQLQPRSLKGYRDLAELLKKQGKHHEATVFEELAKNVNRTRRNQEQRPVDTENTGISETPRLSDQDHRSGQQ